MILRSIFLFLLINFVHLWNENDEEQRIRMINEQERSFYEDELKPLTQMKYKKTSPFTNAYEKKRDYVDDYDQSPKAQPLTRTKSQFRNTEQAMRKVSLDEMDGGNWCYSCVTPIGMLSPEMQTSIKNFFEIRRTEYPRDIVNRECLDGKNVSRIKKEKCLHRYCQTLVLTDHNQGASFVLRGCAENFGAVNVKQFEENEENHCRPLHKTLDMRECICKNRHFCYAGSSRRRSSASILKISSFIFILLPLLI